MVFFIWWEKTEIYATIITEREIHKSMIIGKNGQTIKRIGINSRKLISNFTGQKILVKLVVVVKKDWRKDEKTIKSLNIL